MLAEGAVEASTIKNDIGIGIWMGKVERNMDCASWSACDYETKGMFPCRMTPL